jgi:hypothetical protein
MRLPLLRSLWEELLDGAASAFSHAAAVSDTAAIRRANAQVLTAMGIS